MKRKKGGFLRRGREEILGPSSMVEEGVSCLRRKTQKEEKFGEKRMEKVGLRTKVRERTVLGTHMGENSKGGRKNEHDSS